METQWNTHSSVISHRCITTIIQPCCLTNTITVWTNLEASVALALVGTHGVDTGSIVAYVGWTDTLVQINTGGPLSSQHITWVTDALEAPLEVVANSSLTYTLLVTLIDIWKKRFYLVFLNWFQCYKNISSRGIISEETLYIYSFSCLGGNYRKWKTYLWCE